MAGLRNSGNSGYSEDHLNRERPLVVKCAFYDKKRRITFNAAKNCSCDILRQKVEKCFSLYQTAYDIVWTDDEGDKCSIREDSDLDEAISYFGSEGAEPPGPSNMSVSSSGRSSSGSRKITIYVDICVDYDGPSLSETSSIASREEFEVGDNQSDWDLSNFSRSELEDDEITVSSKDTGSAPGQRARPFSPSVAAAHGVPFPVQESAFEDVESEGNRESWTDLDESSVESVSVTGPFERLKMDDEPSVASDPNSSLLRSERGAAWLRDQNLRTIKSTLGALPEPSDGASLHPGSDVDNNDISLQKGPGGKYYYQYNSTVGSSSMSSIDSGYDDILSVEGDGAKYRPTSMEVAWLDSQQQGSSTSTTLRPSLNGSAASDPTPIRDFSQLYPDIPADVLPFISSAILPPPAELTSCSECGLILDTIRYVCSTCKEKKPRTREELESPTGKGKKCDQPFYPPSNTRTNPQTGSSYSRGFKDMRKLTLPDGRPDPGYELCPGCLESAGVHHALEKSLDPGSSPSPASPEHALSAWRRTAPKQKGKLRHAYVEKSWGWGGWQDVQQDDRADNRCSTCSSLVTGRRYKCVSCMQFNLCRACYSQVHEIHPSHAFLDVVDGRGPGSRSNSDPDLMVHRSSSLENLAPQSLLHQGVKCAHCLQDIVGARFHCVACDSVDICSNCESAGLPGNLDSSDGGHDSSHIMIKIPYPVEPTKVQEVSHRAMARWNGGDAEHVGVKGLHSGAHHHHHHHHHHLPSRSRRSSFDGTVRLSDMESTGGLNHGVRCNSCSQMIIGTRYQCGNCPSIPHPFNLCQSCDDKSYMVHDPTHTFFKLPRPVDRPIESVEPILPILYKYRVASVGIFDSHDPRGYLRNVVHGNIFCDLCMDPIRGQWFHCVYCPRDLCDHCEEVDEHDTNHFPIVAKAPVDMNKFYHFTGMSAEEASGPPIMKYPVYYS